MRRCIRLRRGVSNPDLLEQGAIAARVAISWFTNPPVDPRTLADEIPFLPRRENDYALRSATAVQGSGTCNDSA